MTENTFPSLLHPHFSGHETFPLRQLWLKKAYDQADQNGLVQRSIFTDESAIARFGVGKNMVASIRHWALACDVLRETQGGGPYAISPAANAIFADDGLDPYSEHPTTAWLAHWWLAGRGNRATTWFWMFNHVSAASFSKDELEGPLADFANKLDPKRKLSPSTISRDIETCLRSYAPRALGGSPEDFAEPMLGEIGLLSEEGKGRFAFRRGPKATLSDGMFAFALLDYWELAAPEATSLAFETIAYGEGAPGRVFKLDEESVAERLFGLEDLTGGSLAWTDTAGIRQVLRKSSAPSRLKSKMLEKAYR
jgi:hypothetical protein